MTDTGKGTALVSHQASRAVERPWHELEDLVEVAITVVVFGAGSAVEPAQVARRLQAIQQAVPRGTPVCVVTTGQPGAESVATAIARNKRWRALCVRPPAYVRDGATLAKGVLDMMRPHYVLLFGRRDDLECLEAAVEQYSMTSASRFREEPLPRDYTDARAGRNAA